MFAAGPAEAEAAFKNAVEHRSTSSGLHVLTWTNRWQMPDHHVPGLRAQMWWPELEAAEVLRANSAMLSREFALLLAEGGGGSDNIVNKFKRRRADSWIPVPRDGWGMVQLEACCSVAAATCDLVRKIRGGSEIRKPFPCRESAREDTDRWVASCSRASFPLGKSVLGGVKQPTIVLSMQQPAALLLC